MQAMLSGAWVPPPPAAGPKGGDRADLGGDGAAEVVAAAEVVGRPARRRLRARIEGDLPRPEAGVGRAEGRAADGDRAELHEPSHGR